MLNILVAELPTVLADGQPYAVPAGAVICAEVFGVERLDGETTFYADGHCNCFIWEWGSWRGLHGWVGFWDVMPGDAISRVEVCADNLNSRFGNGQHIFFVILVGKVAWCFMGFWISISRIWISLGLWFCRSFIYTFTFANYCLLQLTRRNWSIDQYELLEHAEVSG